jgi:hypothetical protein
VAGGPPSTILVYIILAEGAPSLRSLQVPALSLPKGWVAMLPTQLLFFRTTSIAHAFVVPALCKLLQRTGHGTALCSDLAHDNRRHFNFLVRLRQPRNNRSKFIEYLVPAL